MEAFSDSQMYNDKNTILQSQLYNTDIPSSAEAHISWFPGPAQKRSTLAATESSNELILEPWRSRKRFLPGSEESHSFWSVDPQGRKSTTTSLTMESPVHAVSHPHKRWPSSLWSTAESAHKNWGAFFYKATLSGDGGIQGPHNPAGSIEKYHRLEPPYDGGSASIFNKSKITVGDNSLLSGPHMHNVSEAYSVNAYGFNLHNSVFPVDSSEAGYEPFVPNSFMNNKSATDVWTPSSSSFKSHRIGTDTGTPSASSSKRKKSAAPKHVHEDEILKNFEQFKKFDIVQDPFDHHYVINVNSVKQPSKSWSKKIQEEWKILEKDLPDTILVRAYESRMDILRVIIVGAKGTPYHDGLFFFDVFFPDHYPNVPPQVHYNSHGLRLNPNLCECGKVCLSLLNTWSGSQKEMWIPKSSTMLQVLVSIQGLILNAKPYFNEPAYAGLSGTPWGEKTSVKYNESTFILSLKTMVFTLQKQPKAHVHSDGLKWILQLQNMEVLYMY